MFRRAEEGEGMDRQQALASMNMQSLEACAVVLMRDERTLLRAMARRPSVQDPPLLALIRRDLGELIGEIVRRMPSWEWEGWADWDPGWKPPITPP